MGAESTINQHEQLPLVVNPDILQQAILYKINTRITARGELAFPCVPGMLNHYLQSIEKLFSTLDRPLPEDRKDELRKLLATKLELGYRSSTASTLIVQYESVQPPQTGLACKVIVASSTVGEQYKSWVDTREPPLFGSYPDAKLMTTAAKLGSPDRIRILDVGAGTGRNTLPLARLGYAVDAIELTPAFAEQLQTAATAENLPVTVSQGDVLDPLVRMKPARYQLAVAAEVISHFRDSDEVRLFLAKMCDSLCPGGLLLFSTFLAVGDYQPDALVRQVAQLSWSTLFTPQELAVAMEGLPLVQVSNELVFDYERDNLPSGAWPPTPWFPSWATGRDVFPMTNARPPMELRWILCQRS
ncbi:bifunctional 2-polyprenyl-6-hydroxyphenol methylase/3-demethylubiquinol 3-O-methyltransferase UbiG [Tychonema sp. BBK16]|uniref:class I SAM-dependent methyltransferase n=1 Tax=Tychonema sp. BBK16 TaxID=2699888 RepID=UPI001F2678A0|nr:class I SAM-dependent methyltransferase [Tychonema sp. BBK16]MCF6375943.1 methyltransferase domain-containing protein [Tychonema sp. BBK16]